MTRGEHEHDRNRHLLAGGVLDTRLGVRRLSITDQTARARLDQLHRDPGNQPQPADRHYARGGEVDCTHKAISARWVLNLHVDHSRAPVKRFDQLSSGRAVPALQHEKQSRQAQYDRLTALPRWARTWGKCPVQH
jgi:hypothetical protein